MLQLVGAVKIGAPPPGVRTGRLIKPNVRTGQTRKCLTANSARFSLGH